MEAFFSGMPAAEDSNIAFVIVQHLDPNHKSILSELIRRYTRMDVFEVEDGMTVRPNCAYVIPPGYDMALHDGSLQLLEPTKPRGMRLPIDFFFSSLAQDQHQRAIGVILSGTGSDGTLGLRAIKGEGGIVMVQTPSSTEFDGMPRSALATGLVDYQLPAAEMPVKLIAYTEHAFGRTQIFSDFPLEKDENTMRKIFVLLRTHTGHDFSKYKPSTIHRRIERRMAVHEIEALVGYVKFLQQNSIEVEALFQELLIGVTRFFRDSDAFQVLEDNVIPALFANKPPGSVIRIWTAGCSTGEEAYSLAILLVEHIESLKQNFTIRLFATDIDPRAIAYARAGVYPARIIDDLNPDRLSRFFVAESKNSAYRIHKNVRDLLVFSEQNVIKDPPFSKLDLITCRNMLIYMSADLQKTLIPLFHYSLNPSGWLFLGTSEGVGEFGELFAVTDRKAKIYRRKDDGLTQQRLPLDCFLSPLTNRQPEVKATNKLARGSLREVTERALLSEVIALGALVNTQGDILYLHGHTGKFLELPPGETGINNVLKMAREGLRRELTTALYKSGKTKITVVYNGLNVGTNDQFSTVNLTVRPLATSPDALPLFLVILQEAPKKPEQRDPQNADGSNLPPTKNTDSRITELKEELRVKEEYLHSTNEELEMSSEELKSSNEEMQSVSEEMQSANEELETSREELQSINEELATVNNELQKKVTDLSRANNDMNNLLAGTGIGTVFLDHQLRILRFTPAASTIINLIISDIGRPVSHIASNLVDYTDLADDVQNVLDTLTAKQIEVKTIAGFNYNLRIQPYRTLDNVIEGAVISFVDITEIVKTREELLKANDLLRLAVVVVRDSNDAITLQDLQGRILAWNPGAEKLYGWSETDALKMNVRDRVPETLREEALAKLEQLSSAEVLESYRTQRLTKTGENLNVSIISTALINDTGKMYAIATTERLITVG